MDKDITKTKQGCKERDTSKDNNAQDWDNHIYQVIIDVIILA